MRDSGGLLGVVGLVGISSSATLTDSLTPGSRSNGTPSNDHCVTKVVFRSKDAGVAGFLAWLVSKSPHSGNFGFGGKPFQAAGTAQTSSHTDFMQALPDALEGAVRCVDRYVQSLRAAVRQSESHLAELTSAERELSTLSGFIGQTLKPEERAEFLLGILRTRTAHSCISGVLPPARDNGIEDADSERSNQLGFRQAFASMPPWRRSAFEQHVAGVASEWSWRQNQATGWWFASTETRKAQKLGESLGRWNKIATSRPGILTYPRLVGTKAPRTAAV